MIVLSKDHILENYFIDQNAVITDKNGNVQKQYLNNGRLSFKQQYVYKIMMNTFMGVLTEDWVVHHIDQNPQNNKLENLVYLTRAEHSRLHNIGKKNPHYGKHLSNVTKAKIRAHHVGMLGQHHSEETKAKMSAAKLGNKNVAGFKWWNNGIKNIRAKECPQGFVSGRLKYK